MAITTVTSSELLFQRGCFVCKTTDQKLTRCASCLIAHYCGQSCQRTDWPSHRKVCKKEARDELLNAEHILDYLNHAMHEYDDVFMALWCGRNPRVKTPLSFAFAQLQLQLSLYDQKDYVFIHLKVGKDSKITHTIELWKTLKERLKLPDQSGPKFAHESLLSEKIETEHQEHVRDVTNDQSDKITTLGCLVLVESHLSKDPVTMKDFALHRFFLVSDQKSDPAEEKIAPPAAAPIRK